MRYLLSVTALLATAALLPSTPAHAKKRKVDHKDPVRVLEAVFDAAKRKDPTVLVTLCDPQSENDGDTRHICELTRENKDWDEFVSYFQKAKISGDAVIQDDRATIPFTFGPKGEDKEEMRLIRRDGNWYLSSF